LIWIGRGGQLGFKLQLEDDEEEEDEDE